MKTSKGAIMCDGCGHVQRDGEIYRSRYTREGGKVVTWDFCEQCMYGDDE